MSDRRDRRLGKYHLIAELAHGAMGEVYLAAVLGPAGFNKVVVLKELPPELAGDPALLSMFLDEARLGARLNHPNIVQTNEVGSDGGRYFIAMEYLEGQTLRRLIQRLGPGELPRALWLRVIADALAGLHHAHEATDVGGAPLHIVHRDVSPENVLVTYDGQIKVVDFGIARALKGRVAAMSPEQARGDPVDRRTDVFAAGVLLWEACTRARMWGTATDDRILEELVKGNIPSLRAADENVTAPLADIVMRALAASPDDRYSTAAHMQVDLEGFLKASGESPSAREAGRLVSQAFLEERLRMKTIVDEQLRRLRAASPDESGAHLSVVRVEPEIAVAAAAPPARRRSPWLALLALAVVAALVAVWWRSR